MDILNEIDKQALKLLAYFTPSIGIFRSADKVIIVEKKGSAKSTKIIIKKEYNLGIENPNFWEAVKKDFDFNNKLVATNLYSSAGLFKLVEAPKMEKGEIKDWLIENISDFFKIPNILEQSILSYSIVDDSSDPFSLLVSLINKEELESIVHDFKENQVSLTTISFHNIHFMPTDILDDTLDITYIRNMNFDEIILSDQSGLLYYNQFPQSKGTKIDEEFVWDRLHQLEAQESHILGLIKENNEKTNFKCKEYSDSNSEQFAASLANYSMVQDTWSIKLLPEKETIQRDNFIWSRLLQRYAIILIVLTVGLLALQFTVSGITNLLINNLTDKTEELRPQLKEIDSLRNYYQSLNSEYGDIQKSKDSRTNTHLILTGLATHMEDNIWLTAIEYDQNSKEDFNTTITGYSKTRKAITNVLSAIEKDENFSDVKLGYVKKMSSKEFFKEWKINSSKYQEYTILFNY